MAIPKPGSQEPRKLGRACGIDRLIQHAMLQGLQGHRDPTFSAGSYGFRLGRAAPQAVAQAQALIEQGDSNVVDIDVAKFFDRVCHIGTGHRRNLLLPENREDVVPQIVSVRTAHPRVAQAIPTLGT